MTAAIATIVTIATTTKRTNSKKKATPAQLAANRANSKKSTGPITPEGKATSSRNAIKHGLRAVIPVLPGEDPQALENRRQAWLDARPPADAIELYLLETAVAASWSLDRARRLEAAAALAPDEPDDEPEEPEKPAWTFNRDQAARELRNHPAIMITWFLDDARALDWMQEQWRRLGKLLDGGYVWSSDDVQLALSMLGRKAACQQVRIDDLSRDIVLALICAFGDINDPEDAAQWMSVVRQVLYVAQYDTDVEELIGTLMIEDLVTSKKALSFLKQLVREQLSNLADRLERLTQEPEDDETDASAEPLPDPLAAPSASLIQRYAARHERVLFQSLRMLDTIQRRRQRQAADETAAEEEAPAPNEADSDASNDSKEIYDSESDLAAGPRPLGEPAALADPAETEPSPPAWRIGA